MQPQTMVVLDDVEAGSRCVQGVLGLRSGLGGPDYERLLDGGTMVAELHNCEADEDPHLGDAADPSGGNGVLLWFATDTFDATMAAVSAPSVTIFDGPLLNPPRVRARSGCGVPKATWSSSPVRSSTFAAGDHPLVADLSFVPRRDVGTLG